MQICSSLKNLEFKEHIYKQNLGFCFSKNTTFKVNLLLQVQVDVWANTSTTNSISRKQKKYQVMLERCFLKRTPVIVAKFYPFRVEIEYLYLIWVVSVWLLILRTNEPFVLNMKPSLISEPMGKYLLRSISYLFPPW